MAQEIVEEFPDKEVRVSSLVHPLPQALSPGGALYQFSDCTQVIAHRPST